MDQKLVVLALIALFVGGGLVTYAHFVTASMEKVTSEMEQIQAGRTTTISR